MSDPGPGPRYYAAIQHFRGRRGAPGFWLVSKVCPSEDRARFFDDGDPGSDGFRVVAFDTPAFGPDAAAALAADYDAVAGFARDNLATLGATEDRGVAEVPQP